jgi:uncharacterized NAD(P)/FAD-binding protein YdhS
MSSNDSARPGTARIVLLLSRTSAIRNGLCHYFAEAGVAADARATLEMVTTVRQAVRAVLVFADEFETADVAAFLLSTRRHRPDLCIIVITRSPALYETMVTADGAPLRAQVCHGLRSGWGILDLVRAAVAGSSD